MLIPWLPLLGVLLTVAGCFLIFSGASGLLPELMAFPSANAQTAPGLETGVAVLVAPRHTREDASCGRIDPAPGVPCAAKPASDPLPAVALVAPSSGAAPRSEWSFSSTDCWGAASDRGSRAEESAHLASLPLCRDPRIALAAMAASLHPERARPSRHTD